MRKTLTLSLAAIATLAAGTAVAQSAERGPGRGAEMTRDVAEQRAAQMFARLDANADGELSSADRDARANARFDAADTNSDGMISREEFAAIREMRGERREKRRAARAERGAERGAQAGERLARREGRRGMRCARAILGQADADSNGTVTQAEFTSAMLARFDAADANNDGTVTREERRAARPEGRGEGQGDGKRGRGRMIG